MAISSFVGSKSSATKIAEFVWPVSRSTPKTLVLASESPVTVAKFVTVTLGASVLATPTSKVKVSVSPASIVFVPVGAFVSDRIRKALPTTSWTKPVGKTTLASSPRS